MRRISTQSIFESATSKPSWQSYVFSGFVHAIVIALLLTITIPVLRETEKARESVTLIAPAAVPESQPKPVQHIAPLRFRPKEFRVPALVSKPAPPAPGILATAPELKAVQPTVPDTPVNLPAPKPLTATGNFNKPNEVAKAVPSPAKVSVGGFGDVNGVQPSSQSRPGPVMMAKVGSFDLPNGEGHSGGGGQGPSGVVRATAFGSISGGGGTTSGTVGLASAVHTGGFGDSTVAPGPTPRKATEAAPSTTPVEILFKPRPAYTAEARNMHLEGQISLEVVFLSTGNIRVVRIVRGLGHGLDEAAQKAALQVRFKPATRGGVPVDTNATINISFELT